MEQNEEKNGEEKQGADASEDKACVPAGAEPEAEGEHVWKDKTGAEEEGEQACEDKALVPVEEGAEGEEGEEEEEPTDENDEWKAWDETQEEGGSATN